MSLYTNANYMEDVRRTAQLSLPWDRLADKAVLISGATGMVGSFLILAKHSYDGLHAISFHPILRHWAPALSYSYCYTRRNRSCQVQLFHQYDSIHRHRGGQPARKLHRSEHGTQDLQRAALLAPCAPEFIKYASSTIGCD